ncbi:MAG TPA: hypothetical protein VHP35_17215, partial [Terriglobia bacterium]|nr:hypothetical protein [Terriglobia bacterium]
SPLSQLQSLGSSWVVHGLCIDSVSAQSIGPVIEVVHSLEDFSVAVLSNPVLNERCQHDGWRRSGFAHTLVEPRASKRDKTGENGKLDNSRLD